jgi:predicted DNA-binding transcriptional regulator YafY
MKIQWYRGDDNTFYKHNAVITRVENELANTPRSQVERLSFIEARLYFLGELQRQDVVQRFSVASVQASRDVALYKQLAPKNLDYDYRARIYLPSGKFKRIFALSTENVLWWLKSGWGDGLPNLPGLPTESVNTICIPDADMLAQVTRAIYRRKVLEIKYLSLSSGYKSRQIAPHALVDSGNRWHVRAFDRDNNRFSDFVINRIQVAQALDEDIASHELAVADTQWSLVVRLSLIPHPKIIHQAAIEVDYRMRGRRLEVCCRAAMVGYMLRRWGVDCSVDRSLNPEEYHLALQNIESLADVESADLAPGFKRTKGQS